MRKLCILSAAAAVSLPAFAFAQTASDMSDLPFDQYVAGELSDADAIGVRGYEDRFSFTGAAGATVAISMSSDSVDCYLFIEDGAGSALGSDDDSGDGTDSRLIVTLPVDGRYTVVATSFSEGTTGPYTLHAAEFEVHPLVPETLEIGDSFVGELAEGDAVLGSGALVDAYDLEIAGGEGISVRLGSNVFDTYLYLVGPTGERVAEDDDGAGSGTDSRIDYTTPAAGVYRVLVSSYGGYSMGTYTLTVTEQGAEPERPAVPLAFGEVVSGVLDASDAPAEGGGHEDAYSVDLTAGEQLEVLLRSDAFDTYLTLRDASGFAVAYDDDSGGDLDSLLSYVAATSGTYQIAVSSYDGSDGPYTVRADVREPTPVSVRSIEIGDSVEGRLDDGDARPLDGGGRVDVYAFDAEAGTQINVSVDGTWNLATQIYAPTGEAFGWDAVAMSGAGFSRLGLPFTGRYLLTLRSYDTSDVAYTLRVVEASEAQVADAAPVEAGTPVAGVLSEDDAPHARGGWMDAYSLQVEDAATFRIAMTSDVVDGYLELYDERGNLIASNDDSSGLNPAVRMFLAAGDYRIVATEYQGGGGPYLLTIDEAVTVPVSVDWVAMGDHVFARLEDSDALSVEQGNPADFYRIEVGAGQTVTVTLNSTEIDTYLLVLDPTGEVVVSDDDSGGNLNSRGMFTAGAAGVYTIVATGYDARVGDYEMNIYEGALENPPGPEL